MPIRRHGADEPNSGLERARHQLRTSGVKDCSKNALLSGIHTRGYLPHVKREGASYFVTFRLADSLPRQVLLDLERRSRELSGSDEINERELQRKVERYLDQGAGSCHLRRSDIADMVAKAMRHFHDIRYVLHEWVVMPNHVHALVWPMPNHILSDILKSWKQFTSRRARRILGLGAGTFWQPESYDHWIRNDDDRTRVSRYIRSNPVAAGLCNRPEEWRWSSAWRGEA